MIIVTFYENQHWRKININTKNIRKMYLRKNKLKGTNILHLWLFFDSLSKNKEVSFKLLIIVKNTIN